MSAVGAQRGRAWFFAPALLYFCVFMLLPVLAIVAVSLTSWSGFDLSQAHWVGFANFRQLGSDALFASALVRTLIFVVATVVGLNLIGLGMALVINARAPGHGFLRVAILVPLGVSPVIAGVVWQVLLGPLGLINHVLHLLGVAQPVNFLGQRLAFPSIIIVALWQFAGYDTMLYFAGLQTLPQERIEAAKVDGAKVLSIVRHVTWPYLRPVTAVVVALNLIGGWKVFDLVYVLTNGGPDNASQVLSTYLYQQAFTFNSLGYASTIALVIMALAVVSVLGYRRLVPE